MEDNNLNFENPTFCLVDGDEAIIENHGENQYVITYVDDKLGSSLRPPIYLNRRELENLIQQKKIKLTDIFSEASKLPSQKLAMIKEKIPGIKKAFAIYYPLKVGPEEKQRVLRLFLN